GGAARTPNPDNSASHMKTAIPVTLASVFAWSTALFVILRRAISISPNFSLCHDMTMTVITIPEN
ncbi:MAG: hypothetical protein ACLPIX_01800, partial [Rhodomicrobium sp.]